MSYATYLQNKLASQKKVVNVRNTTDASQYTYKQRLEANRVFFVDGQGVGSLAMDTSRPNGTPLMQHASTSFKKSTTRPADASDYTAYRGSQGIASDAPYVNGGKKELVCVPSPTPTAAKYKGAGDITKDKLACDKSNALLDPPRFVDNTIRLSAMQPDIIEGCTNGPFVTANHEHSEGLHPPSHPTRAITEHTFMTAPPQFQNPGVNVKKVGGYYNPRSGYVENKHGNDLGVNPRRVPTAFIPTAGAPAHLKINNPTFANVKP